MIKIAINGMGRIGRAVFKSLLHHKKLEVVAVNDTIATDDLAYLLNFDSVYGRSPRKIKAEGDKLAFEDGAGYRVFHEKDPAQLPWKELDIDIVLECTGFFTHKKGMEKHLEAGAGNVILSSPAKDDDIPTVVPGVSDRNGAPGKLISTASCTTNCIAPVVEIMGRRIGIKKANMTTIHAYTSSQSLVDQSNKKKRRGRAAALNFVPTSTGAARATTRILPQYRNLFDGMAIRGPVPAGSVADMNFITGRGTTVEEVNDIFREEAAGNRYRGILGVSEEGMVSSDIIQDNRASVVDLEMTQVVDKDLVKVIAWYDNEWGYAQQMVRQAEQVAQQMRIGV